MMPKSVLSLAAIALVGLCVGTTGAQAAFGVAQVEGLKDLTEREDASCPNTGNPTWQIFTLSERTKSWEGTFPYFFGAEGKCTASISSTLIENCLARTGSDGLDIVPPSNLMRVSALKS